MYASKNNKQDMDKIISMLKNKNAVLVFDTNALILLSSNFPFMALVTADFLQNHYKKLKNKIKELYGVPAREAYNIIVELGKRPWLRKEFIDKLEKREEAFSTILELNNYCAQGGKCVIPNDALRELKKYSVFPDVAMTLEMIENPRKLASEYNSKIRIIKRKYKSGRKYLNTGFFNDLASVFKYYYSSPPNKNILKRILEVIDKLSEGSNLSKEDKNILAYVILNNMEGKPYVLVTTDRALINIAEKLDVPLFDIYNARLENFDKLARLRLSSLVEK